jgi:IS5 family transposase
VCERLRAGLLEDAYDFIDSAILEGLVEQIEYFRSLGLKITDQGRRRVIEGEQVPNEEKIFSIFEPHTELLKRGKAGKPIEFGHMISIQQVEGKFITDYRVFERKPIDYTLIDPALESHRKLFGSNPAELSADKGFYESMDKIEKLEEDIEIVSIGKKGSRTEEETKRETSKAFKLGQQFRAGVEGSISFLKRALGMWRCMNKGWEHYVATVGATVFTHNLLILARNYG